MINQATFFLLPPVRWAVDTRHLDTSTINFKPPEALEGGSTVPGPLEKQHSKFVWKFGIIMYLLISKNYPFTFAEANGSSSSIGSDSAKKFAELIRYRISRGLAWNSTLDPINQLLRQCLVCDPNHRITYQVLRAEFTRVYGYYKPKEESTLSVNLLAQSAFKMAKSPAQETRQAIFDYL